MQTAKYQNAIWEQRQQNQTIAHASASRELELAKNKAIEQLPPKNKVTLKTHLQLAMKELRD